MDNPKTLHVVEFFQWTQLTSEFKTFLFHKKAAAEQHLQTLLSAIKNNPKQPVFDECFEHQAASHIMYVEFDVFWFTIKITEKEIH
jgi:hypothetical protein